jgi:drug/metabolite transporter (DMT)-like permease
LPKAPEPIGLSSTLLALAVSILWAGNVVSIRIGVDSVPPLWSAFWRMLLGVLFVALWALRQRVPILPSRAEFLPLLILGVLFTIQIALLNSATEMTSPAYGVVLLNAYPIFVNLTGHFAAQRWPHLISEERITPIRALGLALSLAGIALLAFTRPDASLATRPFLGNTLMIISSVLLGIRQVYTRWLVQKIDPARSIVWQMALSVPLFLLAAALTEPPVLGRVTPQAIAAISYQGIIVAGICFIVWAELLKKHSAGTLTMFSFIVPIGGIALSAWLFSERLQTSLALGTLLVLAGVYIVLKFAQADSART